MNFASIEEIESLPEFQSLPPEEKETIYTNYISESEKLAKTEEDYNNIMKMTADRKRSAFDLKYKSKFPQDTKTDSSKIDSDPELKLMSDDIAGMYGELDYNVNRSIEEAKAFKADDMADKNRKLAYKPFFYKGKKGYTVTYPNGDSESIPGIENESQLTEFFKNNRLGQFAGEREGAFDSSNPFADDELRLITDKIHNVTGDLGGLAGGIGETRKTISNILQSDLVEDIESIKSSVNRNLEAQSTIDQLTPIAERLKRQKDEFPTRFSSGQQLSEIEYQLQEARDTISNKNAAIGKSRVMEDLNPLSKGLSMTQEEAESQLTEKYKLLSDEFTAQQQIKGSRAMSDLDNYIKSQPASVGEDRSYYNYFKNSPGKLLPYVGAMTASTFPDTVAGLGSAVAGGSVGGPVGAGIAGQAYGFAREYTATLLSEIQLRAAKEGKNLTDSTVIDNYLNDEAFVERIKEKAKTRGAAIGASEAVFGAVTHGIGQSVKGIFKKALATTALESATEGAGELAAQYLAEPNISWRAVSDEMIGGLGAAAPATAAHVYMENKENSSKVILAGATEEARQKLRIDLNARVDAIEYNLNINPVDVTPDKKETFIPEKKEPVITEGESSTEETKESEVTDPTKKEVQSTEKPKDEPIVDVESDKIETIDDVRQNGPSFLNKVLSFFNRNDNSLSDPIIEQRKIDKAREILSNNFNNSVFSILQDTSSYDRFMKEIEESGYDDSRAGILMQAVGLKPEDANKKIITNVLGNIWSHANKGKVLLPHEKKGLLVAEAIDQEYRKEANVTSYYDMTKEEMDSITPDTHILFNLAPDEINEFEDGTAWTTQSQAYSDMTSEESVERFTRANEAKIIRNTQTDVSLDNKYQENKRLSRKNILTTKLSDLKTDDPATIANFLERKYKGRYILKSAGGFAGQGINTSIYSDNSSRPLHEMSEAIQSEIDRGGIDDVYVENLVEPSEKNNISKGEGKRPGFNEFRVHLYVDKNGKAHVFKNLTFNKRRSYFEQNRRAANDSNEDTFIVIPDNPNSPVVKALQEHAKKSMSGKKGFEDNIFGLDMAMIDNKGLSEPFIFETNPMTYGMSGWLGAPISMSEILSEMTGKPSVMAGLYQLAKLGLTREQLNAISSSVSERVTDNWKSNIRYSEAVNKGMDLYNPYIPESKWMQAMSNIFNAPISFLKKLYAAITNVFSRTVDIRFAERQGASGNTKVNGNVQPPTSGTYLGSYINQLMNNPQLTESQRQVLNYIKKNSSDNFLDNVRVKRTSSQYNSYSLTDATIRINKNAPPSTVVHEIVHAVTSDFNNYNSNLVQSIYGYSGDHDNTEAVKAMYYSVDPNNYNSLIDQGVSPDYIKATKVYLSVLQNLGITQQTVNESGSPVGVNTNESYSYQDKNKSFPYGAISMDEMMAEVLSNKAFQKQLSKMPAIFSNARNLFEELVNLISRILRIPVNKDNLLFDSMYSTLETIKSKDNYFFSDSDVTFNSEAQHPVSVGVISDKSFKTDELLTSTKDIASNAKTDAIEKTAEVIATNEVAQRRFSQLKKSYPELLAGMEFDGTNLPEAREKQIDYLYANIDEVDANGKTITKRKKQLAARLVEDKILSVDSLRNLVNNPLITDGHAERIVDSVEFVMDATSDPLNLSTRRIAYYSSVLQSLSDGGPPVGFKYIISERFNQDQSEKLKMVVEGGINFNTPVDKRRGEPIFGRFSGALGSTVSFASETAYIGSTDKARKYLADFMGTFRDNIDAQQLEQQTVESEFYSHLKKEMPNGMMPVQAVRIGLVARLTQYKLKSPIDPVTQIMERYRQLTESIPMMASQDKIKAQLTVKALNEIIGSTDLSTLGDEKAIISFLESKLAPSESSILNKTREIGKRYLPALQTVKAMTRQTVKGQPATSLFQGHQNYVHDVTIKPSDPGETNMLTVFNSMSDVLHDREGIDPETSYPELDIRAVAERQIQSSTYEKHTGIERYLLANALDSRKSSIPSMLDAHTDGSKPITTRLKQILGGAHNSMVRSQPTVGGFIGFAESLMNVVLGHLIIGVNALTKNYVSSAIQRFGLFSLSNEAGKDMFVYSTNKKLVSNFIKEHFPTQFNRTSEYDTIDNRKERWGFNAKKKARMDIYGEWAVTAALKSLPHAPKAVLDSYQKVVLGTLSNYSNAIPEKHNAFAMWTAAYIHFGKENGTIKDANDFTSRLPIDKNAATRASDFVSRSLGYAPDKQSKGTFWNGSTTSKQVLSKTFYVFRQQATGIGIEFQNAAATTSRLYKSGNYDEMARSATFAASLLANSLAFRGLTLALGSAMIYGGLGRFFKSTDDDEKKKKLLEAERKYDASSSRNNTRDFITENLMTFVPMITSAFAVEAIAQWTADTSNIVLDDDLENAKILHKKDLQEEVKAIDEEIKITNKVIKEKELRGIDTENEDEEIEKLEQAKVQLTEKIKFRYFPNRPIKAFLGAYGAYGITAEKIANKIQSFVDDDLDTEEKRKLANMLDNEFTYNDPLGGTNYPWDYLRNPSDFIRNFTEFDKRKEERVPTELYWKSMLSIGQNPTVVVERGRKAMAQEAVKERNKIQKKVDREKARYAGE